VSSSAIVEQLSTIQGMDVAAGLLMVQGDKDLYIRILGQFIDLHEDAPAKIQQAIQKSDLKAIQHLAHSLRGSAGTLGAKAILDTALELEKLAKAHQSSEDLAYVRLIKQLASTISGLSQGYRRAVADWGESKPLAATRQTDPVRVRQVLQELHQLLSASDAQANEQIEHSKDLLVLALGDGARLLEKQILNFDYEDALQTLEPYL
jgi:HPt (histidine-containing phosphotransfer) domain-containing protein